MARAKQYTVSDGTLMLTLTEAAQGGFVVKSPLDPDLLTQAESIEEAFANARSLLRTLHEYRTSRPRPSASVAGAARRPRHKAVATRAPARRAATKRASPSKRAAAARAAGNA